MVSTQQLVLYRGVQNYRSPAITEEKSVEPKTLFRISM